MDCPRFKAIDWYDVPGRGRLAATKLHRTMDNVQDLRGQKVLIDGKLYECLGVEAYMHCPPYHAGESVGLLVDGPVGGSPADRPRTGLSGLGRRADVMENPLVPGCELSLLDINPWSPCRREQSGNPWEPIT